jgi:asparagine synthase (glutamine-hydrolysing)
MCGIIGIWGLEDNLSETLTKATKRIEYRGPDSSGIWYDNYAKIGLAHVRLSILDLSDSGKQPMISSSGRYVIVFNGEIYNHLEIREELNRIHNRNWRGSSDTETILMAIEEWGYLKTLGKLNGMFAFGIWDLQEKQLFLTRDRMGEKPLYWGWINKLFVFGSDLNVFKSINSSMPTIDRNALNLFLKYSYIPAPYSIYKGINKLEPGKYLIISNEELENNVCDLNINSYWSMYDTVKSSVSNKFSGGFEDAVKLVSNQINSSVSMQMLSDVPVGAFLSGGIDSSTIVAFMQENSKTPIQTFTIGFDDKSYDEALNAKKVANYIGTNHTELILNSNILIDTIPKLPSIYSEPFADSSQIPTFLVSQLAKQYVKVVLSGDGGDEIFGGYNRYLSVSNLWNPIQNIPFPLRRSIGNLLTKSNSSRIHNFYQKILPLLPAKFHVSNFNEKIDKITSAFVSSDYINYYQRLTSNIDKPGEIVIGSSEYPSILNSPENWPFTDSVEHKMMAIDSMTYLPDDILTKVDRASMANSLETRVPFLDYNLIELAWRLPLHFKINNGNGKCILKHILFSKIPKVLLERPKSGFAIPLEQWLRGPLRDWAHEYLNPDRIRREGFFHVEPIQKMWSEHLSCKKNWHHELWSILMFQQWLDNEKNN